MFEMFGWLDWEPRSRDAASAQGDNPGTENVLAHRNGVVAYVEVRNARSEWALVREDRRVAAIVGTPAIELSGERWKEPQEVLARLLRRLDAIGDDAISELRGGFSVAVADLERKELLLAIDRVGGRLPLSWAEFPHGMVFGSVSRSVAAHPRVSNEIDPQAIFNYMYFHVIPAPRTAFRRVRRLQPGTMLRLGHGRVTERKYWTPDFLEKAPAPLEEMEGRFRKILRESVAEYASADRVGCYLSGGTDSSSVVGMVREVRNEPPIAFSIGFRADGYDEMEYARIAARHFGADHRESYVGPDDVVQAVPIIAKLFGEPFGNASAVPSYFCARFAHSEGIATLLGGDGGDELFAGNERYATQRVFERYSALPNWFREAVLERQFVGTSVGDSLWLVRKARAYIRKASVPLPQRLHLYNELETRQASEVFCRGFLDEVDTTEPARLMESLYHFGGDATDLNRMLVLDWSLTLADSDLPKVSRTAEESGVAVRYPFLTDEMLEFSTTVPTSWKLKGRTLRWFFKRALREFLPREVLTKSKHGFGLPFGVWMRNHPGLTALANDSLRSLRTRGLISTEYIDSVLRKHREEHASFYGTYIWVLVMLEQWLAHRDADARNA